MWLGGLWYVCCVSVLRSSSATLGRSNTLEYGMRMGADDTGMVQISLGDQSNYYLSTARNELGVMMARSEAGNTMVPISWKEFRDPITGERESRKVAKPL